MWQHLHRLLLPAVTLSLTRVAQITLHTREKMIDAINSSTRYLIADEITASLDPDTQALIWHCLIPRAR